MVTRAIAKASYDVRESGLGTPGVGARCTARVVLIEHARRAHGR